MGIKWKKNKTDDNTPLTTLKSAYELLGIDKFPVTYDEVCTHFYVKTMDSGMSKEQKDKYDDAKNMILAKLSTNPFLPESVSKVSKTEDENGNVEIGLKKESVLETIKKKILQIKCLRNRTGKIEEQVAASEIETDFILLKKKKRFPGSKKNILLIALLISGVMVSILNVWLQSGDMIISKAETVKLLETQGVQLGNETISIAPGNICSYTVQQKAYIPGMNICILERNYLLSTSNILTRVSSQTAYKSTISETGTTIWKKVWENADDYIIDAALSGIWTGSFKVGDDELKDPELNIMVTDNGYIEGTFSFKLANSNLGEIEVACKYDRNNNSFKINGLNWIKRPSLFVTPSLDGYYDYQKGAFVSSKKSDSVFELTNEKTDQLPIFVPMLEQEKASYKAKEKSHDIVLGKLNQFTYIIEDQSDGMLEISYTGTTNRDIINFKINGSAVFEKADALYILKAHSATAEYLSSSITGTYDGTEWIEDEEYKAVYEIYFSETGQELYADVTLTNLFKTIKEKRLITYEDGVIRAIRVDVLSDKVEGDGKAYALIDYERDMFFNHTGLILSKRINDNTIPSSINKQSCE